MEENKTMTNTHLLSSKSAIIIALLLVIYCLIIVAFPFQSSIYTIILFTLLLIIYDKHLGIYFLIFAYPITKRVIIFSIGSEPSFFLFFPYILCFLILLYDNVFHNKKLVLYFGKIDKVIMLLSFYFLYSTFFISTDKVYGLGKFQYFILSIILFYIPLLFTKKQTDLLHFFKAIFLFGITLVIIGYIQLSGINVFFEIGYKDRLDILGLNPIWIARYLSYAILVELYFLLKYFPSLLKNIGKTIFMVSLIILQSYLLILTGSRGPLVGLIFGIMSVIIIRFRINVKTLLLMAIVVLLIILIVGLFIPQDILGRITTSNDAGKITAVIRILSNIEALRYFANNVVFGIGFGSYKFGGEVIGMLQYPHNIFTEILSETGIIGFLLFLYLLIYILINFIRTWKFLDIDIASLILGLFIASFINANLSGHIGGNIYFWFSLGVMHFLNMKISSERSVNYN